MDISMTLAVTLEATALLAAAWWIARRIDMDWWNADFLAGYIWGVCVLLFLQNLSRLWRWRPKWPRRRRWPKAETKQSLGRVIRISESPPLIIEDFPPPSPTGQSTTESLRKT